MDERNQQAGKPDFQDIDRHEGQVNHGETGGNFNSDTQPREQQTAFEEQDAPLKNTDNAFVKVRKDGSPDTGK